MGLKKYGLTQKGLIRLNRNHQICCESLALKNNWVPCLPWFKSFHFIKKKFLVSLTCSLNKEYDRTMYVLLKLYHESQ